MLHRSRERLVERRDEPHDSDIPTRAAMRTAALADDTFLAELHANTVVDAEAYYREMCTGGTSTWNLRDGHFFRVLEATQEYIGRARGRPCRTVVWAHNSHVSDARATEKGGRGETTLGTLCRERLPEGSTYSIGLSTFAGTVTAATHWDGIAERKRVRPALAESYESILHAVGVPRFLLPLTGAPLPVVDALAPARLQRAIGVIYRPQTERASHYYATHLCRQYDALIFIDETRAVEPLEQNPTWSGPPGADATWPTGE